MPRSINWMSQRTRSSLLGVALSVLVLFTAGCSEEEKKPVVSANLCLTLPNGMVLGPYDTDKECQTARDNMPDGKCHICKNAEKKNK
ncbi:MAG: hypothetical protein CMH76_12030 [Nitrospinae bacterium]|nr:hypothetical protein [Nitrospinota bacterium]